MWSWRPSPMMVPPSRRMILEVVAGTAAGTLKPLARALVLAWEVAFVAVVAVAVVAAAAAADTARTMAGEAVELPPEH